jgi:lysophospholipase L1-like esterase
MLSIRSLGTPSVLHVGRKSLVSLGTLLACVLAIEAGLRVWAPSALRMHSTQILLPTNVTVENRWNYDSDKLRDRIVVRRNSLGFRGPDPPLDFAGALSIVTVGGSTTECIFLTEGTTWTDALAAELRAEFHDVWVNNAGIDGRSTFGHAALLEQHLAKLRPKVALFLVGINDLAIEAARTPDAKLVAVEGGGEPRDVFEWLRSRSLILALVQRARPVQGGHEFVAFRDLIVDYQTARPDDELVPFTDAEAERMLQRVAAYRARLEGLVARCRELGIEPILITQPAVYGFGIDPLTGVDLGRMIVADSTENRLPRTGADKWRILQMYNQGTLEVAAACDVFAIDLAAQMPKRTELYYDFIHYTERGAAEVAAIVASGLIPHLRERFPGHLR